MCLFLQEVSNLRGHNPKLHRKLNEEVLLKLIDLAVIIHVRMRYAIRVEIARQFSNPAQRHSSRRRLLSLFLDVGTPKVGFSIDY